MQPQPIQFLREPDDHFAPSGAEVTFVCSIRTFNGLPDISWLHDNTVIKSGSYFKIRNKAGESTSTLTIKSVTAKHQGDYHCCVSDWKTKVRSRSGRLHGK